jgi:hypothetical protein
MIIPSKNPPYLNSLRIGNAPRLIRSDLFKFSAWLIS